MTFTNLKSHPFLIYSNEENQKTTLATPSSSRANESDRCYWGAKATRWGSGRPADSRAPSSPGTSRIPMWLGSCVDHCHAPIPQVAAGTNAGSSRRSKPEETVRCRCCGEQQGIGQEWEGNERLRHHQGRDEDSVWTHTKWDVLDSRRIYTNTKGEPEQDPGRN